MRKEAFLYLIRKKENLISENAKGKKTVFDEFGMAEYLSPHEENVSIEEHKWLFSCRVKDVDIKANHKWKSNNIICNSCNKNQIENQSHLLFCDYLLE